jgi:hypothetical protein
MILSIIGCSAASRLVWRNAPLSYICRLFLTRITTILILISAWLLLASLHYSYLHHYTTVTCITTPLLLASLHHCYLHHYNTLEGYFHQFTTVTCIIIPPLLASLHHCYLHHHATVTCITTPLLLASLHHCYLHDYIAVTCITTLLLLSSLHCCYFHHCTAVTCITAPLLFASQHHCYLHCYTTVTCITTPLLLASCLLNQSTLRSCFNLSIDIVSINISITKSKFLWIVVSISTESGSQVTYWCAQPILLYTTRIDNSTKPHPFRHYKTPPSLRCVCCLL